MANDYRVCEVCGKPARVIIAADGLPEAVHVDRVEVDGELRDVLPPIRRGHEAYIKDPRWTMRV